MIYCFTLPTDGPPGFMGPCQAAHSLSQATHIRLWPMSVDRDGPSSKPLRMEERASLQYMTNGQKERDKKERVLYWEELSIPLEEMEQKIPLKIVVCRHLLAAFVLGDQDQQVQWYFYHSPSLSSIWSF